MTTAKTASLNCYYHNSTSIKGKGKLYEFNNHFHSIKNEFDIVAITESWLDESVFDGEILVNSQYNLFRRDRDATTSSKSCSGGVLLAVANEYACVRRMDLETSMELLWVEVKLDPATSLFVGVAYLPKPSTSVLEQLELSLDKTVSQCRVNDNILIFGDWNCRDMVWSTSDISNGTAELTNKPDLCSVSTRFHDIMESCALSQHNVHRTCNDNQLDLIFSSGIPVIVDVSEKATTSTHFALEAQVNIRHKPDERKVEPRVIYNFKKTDWDYVHQLLTCICWSNLLGFPNVHDATQYFYDIIFAIMTDCVPTFNVKPSRYPTWYNHELITLIKEKARVHSKYLKRGKDKTSGVLPVFCKLT